MTPESESQWRWSTALAADALSLLIPGSWLGQVLPPLRRCGAPGAASGCVHLGRLQRAEHDYSGRAAYFDWLDTVPAGAVVVVDVEELPGAVLGDLLARRLLQRGAAAFVTNGMVRDVPILKAGSLAVWAQSAVPVGGLRGRFTFEPAQRVVWGGTAIETGDWFVADDDGALVVPAKTVPDVDSVIRDIYQKDEGTVSRIERGYPLREAYPSKGCVEP